MIRVNVMTKRLWKNIRDRRYRERHPEKIAERWRRWIAANPKRVQELKQNAPKRAKEYTDKVRTTARKWYDANPDQIKLCECGCGQPTPIALQTSKKWGRVKGRPTRFVPGHATRGTRKQCACGAIAHARGLCHKCEFQANKVEITKQTQEWAKANPDKVRVAKRKWKKAHPEYGRLQAHRRRVRKFGNGGSYTVEEWETLKTQYGHRCVGCWRTETELITLGYMLVPDHIVSLSKRDCEGRLGLNCIENIQPLCHSHRKGVKGGCNEYKGAKYIDFVIS
jgi:hypothetical protein